MVRFGMRKGEDFLALLYLKKASSDAYFVKHMPTFAILSLILSLVPPE